MGRIVFRVLKHRTARRDDFLSYKALGKPLWRPTPARERRWSGVSAFETEKLCRSKAHDLNLGSYIAKLDIPDDAPIQIEQGYRGHVTVYGEPESFLSYLVSVVAVQENENDNGI